MSCGANNPSDWDGFYDPTLPLPCTVEDLRDFIKEARLIRVAGADHESQQRFAEGYASRLHRQARRRDPMDDEEQPAQSPQEAAKLLIAEAISSLIETPTQPAAVNEYLIESLEAIFAGKDADVAFGIRAASGNPRLDDETLLAILAHVELGRRRGNQESDKKNLAAAKKATLQAISDADGDGDSYSESWLNKLLGDSVMQREISEMTVATLENVANIESVAGALRKGRRKTRI